MQNISSQLFISHRLLLRGDNVYDGCNSQDADTPPKVCMLAVIWLQKQFTAKMLISDHTFSVW